MATSSSNTRPSVVANSRRAWLGRRSRPGSGVGLWPRRR
jgi:hypothetical protein